MLTFLPHPSGPALRALAASHGCGSQPEPEPAGLRRFWRITPERLSVSHHEVTGRLAALEQGAPRAPAEEL